MTPLQRLRERLDQRHDEILDSLGAISDQIAVLTKRVETLTAKLGVNDVRAIGESPEHLIDGKAVAARLSVSTATVRRMWRAGRLPSPLLVGNRNRWREEEIDRLIDSAEPPAGRNALARVSNGPERK